MGTKAAMVGAIAVAFVGAWLVAGNSVSVQGQAQPNAGFAAVPGEKGGLDITGPYEVVADWPKPLANMPGHQNWTWGSVQGVFAESPNRVYMVQRGELPAMPRPSARAVPDIGPSLSFPVGQAPFRNASQGPASSPPGAGGPGQDPDDPKQAWQGRMGVDARWEHTIVVFNAAGDLVEGWTQWDKMMKRPHSVYVSPYDGQKNVWIVDDHSHAIFKFTNDGKQLLQTLGTPGKAGSDGAHFNRPTFMSWLPDGSFFVADGYNGNRVAKFDKDGKFLWTSGELGAPGGREIRPGYFNTVHGIAVDPMTRRVYVSDRSNRRIQVLDGDNGKVVDQWPVGTQTNLQFLIIPADRSGVWGFTDTTAKIAKWDFNGRLLYSWGVLGDFPGAFFNMHGASVDQEGNLYVAEVGGGRLQKFRPRKGANPAFLVGPPVYSAWK
jgi:DNA-binding beta-propeller fold protein YncE